MQGITVVLGVGALLVVAYAHESTPSPVGKRSASSQSAEVPIDKRSTESEEVPIDKRDVSSEKVSSVAATPHPAKRSVDDSTVRSDTPIGGNKEKREAPTSGVREAAAEVTREAREVRTTSAGAPRVARDLQAVSTVGRERRAVSTTPKSASEEVATGTPRIARAVSVSTIQKREATGAPTTAKPNVSGEATRAKRHVALSTPASA